MNAIELFPTGALWIPATTPAIIREALRDGSYERDLLDLIPRYIHSNDTVLEAGAGLGVVTIALSALAQKVWAVEANPELLECLERNVAPWVNVETLAFALSDDPAGVATLSIHDEWWNSALVGAPPSRYGREVRRATVTPYRLPVLAELLDATALVLDVEGAEYTLLREPLPTAIHTAIIEWHGNREHDLLLAQGFWLCETLQETPTDPTLAVYERGQP